MRDTDRVPAGPRLRDVEFSSGDLVLAGWLAVPARDEALAGVVLVGGLGSSDRDSVTYVPPIREHLADAGNRRAVLRQTRRWLVIRRLAGLDPGRPCRRRHGRAGLPLRAARGPGRHGGAARAQRGGWVVLRAAAGRDDVPWVITSGCPGLTPAAQERHALAGVLRRAGEQDADSILALFDRLAEAGRRGGDFAEAARIVSSARPSRAFRDYWSDRDER